MTIMYIVGAIVLGSIGALMLVSDFFTYRKCNSCGNQGHIDYMVEIVPRKFVKKYRHFNC
jgi:hypothetical protein